MSDVKTIRVAMAGRAMCAGRRCAEFWREATIKYMFRVRRGDLLWSLSDGASPALVDVPINTLEPTDDGDPDELQLCEQAQREERAK